MANSRYYTYEYEIVSIESSILDAINKKIDSSKELIRTANEDEITPYHLAWIKSFQAFIDQIDPNGEIDSWSNEHSESLVKQWYSAQFTSYSSHDIKTLKLSPKQLDAKVFHNYMAVLLYLQGGKAKIVKSKKSIHKEISSEVKGDGEKVPLINKKVFIVHGHDDTAKLNVARFIEKLGFDPVILHEQANSGKTIIEKIETYSDVGFAVVLYTPCDKGGAQNGLTELNSRARQNVVFEHGYLISKLGRVNVCALVKEGVETPSDISGVLYVPFDSSDGWCISIAKELRNSGYDVDMNLVV